MCKIVFNKYSNFNVIKNNDIYYIHQHKKTEYVLSNRYNVDPAYAVFVVMPCLLKPEPVPVGKSCAFVTLGISKSNFGSAKLQNHPSEAEVMTSRCRDVIDNCEWKFLEPLLLTPINFNPSMDKFSRAQKI